MIFPFLIVSNSLVYGKLLIFVSNTLLNYYQDLVDFSIDSLGVSLYIIISLANRNSFPLFSHMCILSISLIQSGQDLFWLVGIKYFFLILFYF